LCARTARSLGITARQINRLILRRDHMPHPYLEGTPEQKAAQQRAADIKASQGATPAPKK